MLQSLAFAGYDRSLLQDRRLAMTVPYRAFIIVGVAASLVGAGYILLPRSGAATVATVPTPQSAPLVIATPPVAPTAKPASTLVANRAPVPMATRQPTTYFVPTEAQASVQAASATTVMGGSVDGGLPPAPGDAKSDDSSQAKAAIELDGYKNVRGLAKGPDGVWRGRAMRGRTEIAIRVDATGSVSAD